MQVTVTPAAPATLAQIVGLEPLPRATITPVPVTSPVLTVTHFDAVNLDEALAKVEKFNRRAARAGIEGAFEVAHSTAFVVEKQSDHDFHLGLPVEGRDIVTFVVLGQPLVREGFVFVATLSFDSEAGVITRPVPGAPEVSLDQYRGLTAPVCDSCGTRRQRKDVYVLLSEETGELSVVGSNCLAAYLGLDVSGSLAWIGEQAAGKLEGSFGFAATEWRFPSTTVLAVASAAIAAFGWVAKSAYEGVPTSSRVEDVLYPLPTNKYAREAAEATRAAVAAKLDETGGPSRALARAEEVLAWVRAGEVGTSEYAQNLQAILGAETVSGRNLGLAVSAVSSWAKAQDRVIERQERAARAAQSTWVGEVGGKLELAVELVAQPRFIQGDYGVSTLLVFADEAGNVFKWFASGSKDWTVGTRFTGKATVKKHEDYNGTKSTVITRAKLEEVAAS